MNPFAQSDQYEVHLVHFHDPSLVIFINSAFAVLFLLVLLFLSHFQRTKRWFVKVLTMAKGGGGSLEQQCKGEKSIADKT